MHAGGEMCLRLGSQRQTLRHYSLKVVDFRGGSRGPRRGMEIETVKEGSQYRACYQASYHSGKLELSLSGSLWEAA